MKQTLRRFTRAVIAEFRRLLKARDPDIDHISRVLCALVAIMLLTGGAGAAHAHIPSECAVHVQELQWALEGQATTREHVETSHNVVVTQVEEFGEADHRFRPGLIEQYIRMDKQVRHKALMLFGCILESQTLSLSGE